MRVASCLPALLLASCTTHSDPGAPAIVSIEPVPVRWVVVSITYPMPGNESWVWYAQPPSYPGVDADRGARWGGAVRSADASERSATLAPIDVKPVTPVTATSIALGDPLFNNGYGRGGNVKSHSGDVFVVWLNPTAVVTTYADGGRSVAWSSTDSAAPCAMLPWRCQAGAAAMWQVAAGVLQGVAPPWFDEDPAILDWLGPDDRAAILAHDPFLDPAFDPATIPADARFEHLRRFTIPDQVPPVLDVLEWPACAGAVANAASPVLLERVIPFGRAETFVVQYAFFSPTGTCETQRPGVILGTSTPGCSMEGDLYVDRVFGTVLPIATSVSAACTP